jgi:hypothetical protein
MGGTLVLSVVECRYLLGAGCRRVPLPSLAIAQVIIL